MKSASAPEPVERRVTGSADTELTEEQHRREFIPLWGKRPATEVTAIMLIHDGILFEESDPEKIEHAKQIMIGVGQGWQQ